MDLNVTITLSDRLFCLLEDKLPSVGRRVSCAVGRAIKAAAMEEVGIQIQERESTFADVYNPDEIECRKNPKVTITPVPKKKKEETPAKEETAGDEEPDETKSTPMPPVPDKAPDKVPDMVDVRAAIDRTRRRFEGEDYETNKNSEGYKKYHAQLSSMFRQIAALLGAANNKPGGLPKENIGAFISACDELVLDDHGLISAPKAPF